MEARARRSHSRCERVLPNARRRWSKARSRWRRIRRYQVGAHPAGGAQIEIDGEHLEGHAEQSQAGVGEPVDGGLLSGHGWDCTGERERGERERGEGGVRLGACGLSMAFKTRTRADGSGDVVAGGGGGDIRAAEAGHEAGEVGGIDIAVAIGERGKLGAIETAATVDQTLARAGHAALEPPEIVQIDVAVAIGIGGQIRAGRDELDSASPRMTRCRHRRYWRVSCPAPGCHRGGCWR